jgi:serine-type D-Ala-D-Ala endopeptidase (penicillin-binding protein 7)
LFWRSLRSISQAFDIARFFASFYTPLHSMLLSGVESMSNFRVRLSTLLQKVAMVMMVAALALPMSAQAGDRKTGKTVRKTSTQVVERKKRDAVVVEAKSKNRRAQKSAVVLTKARKGEARLAASEGKNSSRHTSLAKKREDGRGVSRVAASRKDRVKVVVARSSSQRGAVRLVAHRPFAPQVQAVAVEPRASVGEQKGLHASDDPLELNSSVALVVDQQTNEVLFSKNDSAVLPIASLTKLMTGLVVTDANLPLDDLITISADDIDTVKGSRSRLAVGTTLTRRELMHLALMSSENRAAHALGRTYPGGLDQFVRLMNAKARELGMRDTRYVEPTGLSSLNQSSARDLATLVSVAYQRPILRSLSTSPSHQLDLGHRTLEFRNSNGLIRNPDWDIGLQKTGYISEAGRCLVMQTRVAGRQLIMVFLDATGKLGRAQDAERVRRWVEAQTTFHPAVAARPQG